MADGFVSFTLRGENVGEVIVRFSETGLILNASGNERRPLQPCRARPGYGPKL